MLIPSLTHPSADQPVPVEGCITCTHLEKFRERASAAGDGSGVSDANVRMRRHQEDEHR